MNRHSKLKFSLQNLEPDEFESFVASVWSARGWSTEVTQSSRDRGIDIIATKSSLYEEKALIQAKCYKEGNKVGRPEIQQYDTLQRQESGVDKVIVVTSSSFTREAKSLAEQLNLKTVNGEELAEAALTHLSDDMVADIIQRNKADVEESDSAEKATVSTDNLTESELDLAKTYNAYFRRLKKNLRDGDQERALLFDLETDKEDTSEYSVVSTTHRVKFHSDTKKVWLQFQRTVDKYGWKIKNAESYKIGAGGVEMIASPDEAHAFSLIIDTADGRSASPKRQAKISNLILKNVYNTELSGITVNEFGMGIKGESYSKEIK